MNIQLNNLGPIKEFNFDLSKDLTIIFGKNNIGKSYAISAIYLILKSFSNDDFRDNPIEMALYFYRREKKSAHGQPKVIKEIIELEELVNNTLKKEEQIEISKAYERMPNSALLATAEFMEDKIYYRRNEDTLFD